MYKKERVSWIALMSTTAMATTITILSSFLFAVWLAVSNCIYDSASNAYSNLLHYSRNHVNIFPSPRIAGRCFFLRITVNRRLCALCKVVFMHTPLVSLLVNTCSFSILWSHALSLFLSLSLLFTRRWHTYFSVKTGSRCARTLRFESNFKNKFRSNAHSVLRSRKLEMAGAWY